MYHWKAYLPSTWAGQSLSKYVLSRRAATNSTAAHVVPTEAFSAAFGLTFHLISHVSVVTNSPNVTSEITQRRLRGFGEEDCNKKKKKHMN